VSAPTDEEAEEAEAVSAPEPMPEPEPERTATEERDFLLKSLDDLDAEYEAGDLDQADYDTLRDGYVARTAEVLRAIDEHRDATLEAPLSPRRRRRSIAWIAGVLVVAAVAGTLLARSVGAKGSGAAITGSAPSALDSCQTLSFQKPAQGVTCYDKILRTQPQNTDALTYKGWALVRMGKIAEGSKLFDQVVGINKRYPDVYVFRASVKANAGDYQGAQAELNTLYALNPPAGVISTLQSQGLDREVAYGLLPAPVQNCWKTAEDGLVLLNKDASSTKGTTDITNAVKCLSDLLSTDPNNLDALNASGYLLGSSGSVALLPQAQVYLDHAVAVAPTDPTARLLRAALENSTDNAAAANADLKVLKALGPPSRLYPMTPTAEIQQQVDDQLKATTTTTG
jgi:tetratricopeptide (TPR) repeat protein